MKIWQLVRQTALSRFNSLYRNTANGVLNSPYHIHRNRWRFPQSNRKSDNQMEILFPSHQKYLVAALLGDLSPVFYVLLASTYVNKPRLDPPWWGHSRRKSVGVCPWEVDLVPEPFLFLCADNPEVKHFSQQHSSSSWSSASWHPWAMERAYHRQKLRNGDPQLLRRLQTRDNVVPR